MAFLTSLSLWTLSTNTYYLNEVLHAFIKRFKDRCYILFARYVGTKTNEEMIKMVDLVTQLNTPTFPLSGLNASLSEGFFTRYATIGEKRRNKEINGAASNSSKTGRTIPVYSDSVSTIYITIILLL